MFVVVAGVPPASSKLRPTQPPLQFAFFSTSFSVILPAMASSSLWQRFQNYFLRYDNLDFSIDISRMKFPDDFFDEMRPRIDKASAAMRELESGAIANPDEKRMVGHYWLRNPALAPNAQLRADIEETNERIKKFAADVHAGKIVAEGGKRFQHI